MFGNPKTGDPEVGIRWAGCMMGRNLGPDRGKEFIPLYRHDAYRDQLGGDWARQKKDEKITATP